MATTVVRQLDADDATAYRALRLQLLQDAPDSYGTIYEEAVARPLEHTANRLREQRDSEVGHTVGAFGPDLIGMATLLREDGAKSRHRATVVGMGVAPEARGRGIGRKLLEALIAHARQIAELEQLYLTVVIPNESARRLYRSVGFVTYGIDERGLKLGDQYWDEVQMVLFLR